MSRILLTSEREIKKETVIAWLKAEGIKLAELGTVKCNFHTPEQPLGPGIIAAARARLSFASSELVKPAARYDLIITLENGIIDAGNKTMWDVNYALIYDCKRGVTYYGVSSMHLVPDEWCAAIREKADYTAEIAGAPIKLGMLMHQKNPAVDPNNWFASMPGYPDRSEQMTSALKAAWQKKKISDMVKTYENFPNDKCPVFEDLSSIWRFPSSHLDLTNLMLHELDAYGIVPNIIIGPELRGVPLATSLQMLMYTKWVRDTAVLFARKPGKLPGPVDRATFKKEYGEEESIEIQTDLISPTSRVLIVDDVIATGGTLNAMVSIILAKGVNPDKVHVVVLREIKEHRSTWQAQPELKKISLVRVLLGDGDFWRR